jgi:hypothetical protein
MTVLSDTAGFGALGFRVPASRGASRNTLTAHAEFAKYKQFLNQEARLKLGSSFTRASLTKRSIHDGFSGGSCDTKSGSRVDSSRETRGGQVRSVAPVVEREIITFLAEASKIEGRIDFEEVRRSRWQHRRTRALSSGFASWYESLIDLSSRMYLQAVD